MKLLLRTNKKGMDVKKHILTFIPLFCFFFSLTFVSCKNSRTNPVIIWTNNVEFASYVELFNAKHKDTKAVVVYKESPASSLPPAKDELAPDLVVGPWLKNSKTRKNFTPMDYLLGEQGISRSSYYNQVINYGIINEKQYLLPVSFNLPLIIYGTRNENLITTTHLISIDQMKTMAKAFNAQGSDGSFTKMGYAPSWDSDFIYEVTKLKNVSYREKGASFSWNAEEMKNTLESLKAWTTDCNADTSSEQNFQFKYLYMPKYKQVATGRCLFAYTTSDEFFKLTEMQSQGISFRWLEENMKIPVEDSIVTMGLYKKSRNTKKAEEFIGWFAREDTQRELLERTQLLKLDTITFGIAGGFSAIKSVNEKIYPLYYRSLLANLPTESYLTMPNILPPRWMNLKQRVVIPFISDGINTAEKESMGLEERISDWTKQY